MNRYVHVSSTSISTVWRHQLRAARQAHIILDNAQLRCQCIIRWFASSHALSIWGDECQMQVLHTGHLKTLFPSNSANITFSSLFLELNQYFYQASGKALLPVLCFVCDLSSTNDIILRKQSLCSTLYIESYHLYSPPCLTHLLSLSPPFVWTLPLYSIAPGLYLLLSPTTSLFL